MVQGLWGKFWLFLIKLSIDVVYDLAILLLGTDPRKMKTTYVYKKTGARIFIAALLTTANTWKQLQWPSK